MGGLAGVSGTGFTTCAAGALITAAVLGEAGTLGTGFVGATDKSLSMVRDGTAAADGAADGVSDATGGTFGVVGTGAFSTGTDGVTTTGAGGAVATATG